MLDEVIKTLLSLWLAACPSGARLVPLTRCMFAFVDEADYEAVTAYSWCYSPAGKGGYAVRGGREGEPSIVHMHRQITGAATGEYVDHINRYTFDNRRSNLRKVSKSVNGHNIDTPAHNTSGCTGVSQMRSGRWRARTKVYGKEQYIGAFDTRDEAAKAYTAFCRDRIYASAEHEAAHGR